MSIYQNILLPIIIGVVVVLFTIIINKVFLNKSSKGLVFFIIFLIVVSVFIYIFLENDDLNKTEGSDTETENAKEIDTYNSDKQIILENIEKYGKDGNYEDVISYINTLDTEYQNDNDIISKYNINIESYREKILTQAKEAYEPDKIEESIRIIETGLDVLPDDPTFKDAIKEYRSHVKIALFEMQPLYKNGSDIIFSHRGDVKRPDNVGNFYSAEAYEIFAGGNGNDCSITFALDEKYTLLTGELAIRQNEGHESLWVEFYDGDILLGKSDELGDGVRPIKFEIDVTGVTDLTIKAKTYSSFGFAYTEGFYVQK